MPDTKKYVEDLLTSLKISELSEVKPEKPRNKSWTLSQLLSYRPVYEALIGLDNISNIAKRYPGLGQPQLSRLIQYVEDLDPRAVPENLRKGVKREGVPYPILAHVPAGYKEGHAHEILDPIGTYWADQEVRLIGDKLQPFAFMVTGDSMTDPESPTQFEDGDVVLIDPNLRQAINNRDFIVASDYSGKMTLKQFLQVDGRKILHPLNPAFPDLEWDDEIHWVVGVVVEGKRPERLLYERGRKSLLR